MGVGIIDEMGHTRSAATDAIVGSRAVKKLVVTGPGTGKAYTFKQALESVDGKGLAGDLTWAGAAHGRILFALFVPVLRGSLTVLGFVSACRHSRRLSGRRDPSPCIHSVDGLGSGGGGIRTLDPPNDG